MSVQARSDTQPELAIRRELHRRGLRYRVNFRAEPGLRSSPDIVFTRARVAVFVDGCFWHRCPVHGTSPAANAEWWQKKLDRNVERDRDVDRRLEENGWQVVRIWEHEDALAAADDIQRTVSARSSTQNPRVSRKTR